jgi:hypothetical protein
MCTITIENLIKEGKSILDGIRYIPSRPNSIRTYAVYALTDEVAYERWKNIVLRFLSTNYYDDVSVSDFRTAMDDFQKNHYSPSCMKRMIGILESYTVFPTAITKKSEAFDKPSIVINNTNSQEQNLSQNYDIIIKSIEDCFSISQIKELHKIIENEHDIEKAKPKIIEKLKSFGENLAPSIVANILTNPSIWTFIF